MDIIDLDQTLPRLKAAMNVLANTAFRKGSIVFVIEDERYKHQVDVLAKSLGQYSLNKSSLTSKITRKRFDYAFFTGEKMPDCFFFFSLHNEFKTQNVQFYDWANMVHACSIGVVDTDVNPTAMTYRIPSSDDGEDVVNFYCDLIEKVVVRAYKMRAVFEKSK